MKGGHEFAAQGHQKEGREDRPGRRVQKPRNVNKTQVKNSGGLKLESPSHHEMKPHVRALRMEKGRAGNRVGTINAAGYLFAKVPETQEVKKNKG